MHIERFIYSTLRPFMNGHEEPNAYYRSWLESNVGKQEIDWNWNLCPKDFNKVEIHFKDKSHATLFELKWAP